MGDDLEAECNALRRVVEASADVVAVLSPAGKLLRSFRSRLRLFGWEPDEVAGVDILELIDPEDHAKARKALAELTSPGAEVRVELRVRTRGGELVDVECQAQNRVDDPTVGGIILHCHDIRERRALEQRLHTAIRAEAVGRVAGAVAHDFNNILSTVLLSVRALELDRGSDKNLDALRDAAEQGAALTRRLLAFVRQKPTPTRAVELNTSARAVVRSLARLLPPNVVFHTELAPAEVFVEAEPGLLEQALINLVLNARDAMPTGGNVRLRVEPADERGWVRLLVSDDGPGMDEPTREHAFEPFFTTRSEQGGTGLGLWSVSDIIERFGGSVSVESALGRGTTFCLRLPARDAPEAAVESEHSAEPEVAGALVLLVEDRDSLRTVLACALRDHGYRVLEAADGVDALERVLEAEERPSILVSDVLMPRMGGTELSRMLRARLPDLPVLFMSGYVDDSEPTGIGGPVELLTKPFETEALLRAMKRLMRQSRRP